MCSRLIASLLFLLASSVSLAEQGDPLTPNAPVAVSDSALAGTAWQLVKIMSMDDSTYEPRDRSLYRLEFRSDSSASILADCNRGTGFWTSEAPPKLRFGPLASTSAMCQPGSIAEKFMAEFQWVRSYTMKDGHLFLATMADGSIIEFEPLAPVAAIVLGEQIRSNNATEMQSAVLTRLMQDYASRHGIETTDTEIDAWVANLQRGMRASGLTAADELTGEEADEVARMRQQMGKSMIQQWKINRALYQQYGGRIIFQQFGPEPLDAYRQFLQEQYKAGTFSIRNPAFESEFWRYFTDNSIHSFMEQGSVEEARAFEVPPWEQAGAAKGNPSNGPILRCAPCQGSH